MRHDHTFAGGSVYLCIRRHDTEFVEQLTAQFRRVLSPGLLPGLLVLTNQAPGDHSACTYLSAISKGCYLDFSNIRFFPIGQDCTYEV
jgi:hypothetical protein